MQDFIGLSEIAELANATPQTVNNWKKRYADFPLPVAKIKAGEFYDKDTIDNNCRIYQSEGWSGKNNNDCGISNIVSRRFW